MRLPILLNTGLLLVASAVYASTDVSADVPVEALSDRAAVFALEQQSAGVVLADKLWGLAELGYLEYQSSAELQSYLAEHGFTVEPGVGGIPTAFVATFRSGAEVDAGPVVALLAEFDALPGLNQAALPYRQVTEERAAGHACGHHLFGAASAAAAVALSQWLQDTQVSATIKLVGTPAEEGGSGKVYLARAGVFDGVDVVLHWHPGDGNSASPSSTTSNKSGRFTFTGRAAHAASAPDRGRSALDGVEAMNYVPSSPYHPCPPHKFRGRRARRGP